VTTLPAVYSRYELAYQVLDTFGDFFWCDPHLWPIVREDQEQQDALKEFPSIKTNEFEFMAILKRLSMDNKDSYSDEEKLLVFRQHKLLTIAVETAPAANGYSFTLRLREGQGERIEGTITTVGKITVGKREPSINTCPICLVEGTIIDTPVGAVPVEDIRTGMQVWTLNGRGERVSAAVVVTAATPVSLSHQVVAIRLDDGRAVTASPAHPTEDGRTLGSLKVGDMVDGALVKSADLVVYDGVKTYDILPSGDTGLYWANGVILASTLGR
jgi:hypothetical protein